MAATSLSTTKGFARSLFDFQFSSLIAARFLKVLYAVLAILLTIGAVVFALSSLSRDNGVAIAIAVVVMYFIELIWLRIAMEFLIVFFQIGENVAAIRAGGLDPTRGGGLATPTTPDGPAVGQPTPEAGASSVASTPAGWFDAPGDPTQYRYWDGSAWTEQYSPKGGSA